MVTIDDLKDQTLISGTEFLYCEICGSEYSANKADYFLMEPGETFTCCNEPMRLAKKVVHFNILK